jgi:hypothetical protein
VCANTFPSPLASPLRNRSRARRMAAALERTGASVLSGITLTKLVGVAVLAFAQTQVRMGGA